MHVLIVFLVIAVVASAPIKAQKVSEKYYQVDCKPGEYAVNETCAKCPPSTYNPEGQGLCIDCQSGYSSFEGAAKCDPCPIGSYATGACLGGCQIMYIQKYGRYNCIPCPNTTQCAPCLPGSFEPREHQTSCSKCVPGTYNPTAGASSAEFCLPCTRGHFCPVPGMTVPHPCDENQYCSGTGALACDNCGILYRSKIGATECTLSPAVLLCGAAAIIILVVILILAFRSTFPAYNQKSRNSPTFDFFSPHSNMSHSNIRPDSQAPSGSEYGVPLIPENEPVYDGL